MWRFVPRSSRSSHRPRRFSWAEAPIWAQEQAQSLIEVAIFLPVVLLLVCYAVDYGYFFMTAASVAGAARTAAEYSVQGYSSPSQAVYAPPASVNTAAINDISFKDTSTVTKVQVCSPSAGTTGKVVCKQYNSSATYALDADPEPTQFLMNRVDVEYTVNPPIPLPFFQQSIAAMNIHRSIEIRAY